MTPGSFFLVRKPDAPPFEVLVIQDHGLLVEVRIVAGWDGDSQIGDQVVLIDHGEMLLPIKFVIGMEELDRDVERLRRIQSARENATIESGERAK